MALASVRMGSISPSFARNWRCRSAPRSKAMRPAPTLEECRKTSRTLSGRPLRMQVGDGVGANRQRPAHVIKAIEIGHAGLQGHGHRQGLENRAELEGAGHQLVGVSKLQPVGGTGGVGTRQGGGGQDFARGRNRARARPRQWPSNGRPQPATLRSRRAGRRRRATDAAPAFRCGRSPARLRPCRCRRAMRSSPTRPLLSTLTVPTTCPAKAPRG